MQQYLRKAESFAQNLRGAKKTRRWSGIMWKNIKIDNIGAIEKCVGEFQILAYDILPYGKMKIKVYQRQDGMYYGYTDLKVRRKFDNSPEGAIGYGSSVEEALEDTIKYFMEILDEDYSDGITEEDIEYSEYSDF